ncbi:MAG: TonB-dependent receptor plug domain-containing protein [Bacteroidetes bacterium]|nr:TonB-dependent receptor plug domain-containing protein [Bacteroidota bacterium]MBS1930836.1 TonB-dependent receptor plug domain-containing protein [Bacteroidota bacterium]
MKKKVSLILLFCFFFSAIRSQQNVSADSVKVLGEVVLKAYEQNRQLKQIATAVNYISQQDLERSNDMNILPAFNNTPGVRMEERSPGSYRINIRGSTVRSPFGVRNVKVYWNGIPFTDPGGNTYLNQLSYYNFNSIEIIKGPAGSLYGAGTGGAILINSLPPFQKKEIGLHYLYGSFGTNNIDAQWNGGTDKIRNIVNYSHQSSSGYRDHTALRRDIATWQMQIKANKKDQLNLNFLYGDLYYQTPGALNNTEYTNNPKQARPAAGSFPSAEGAKAAIFQKTGLLGICNTYQFTNRFENTSILYGTVSHITNPTFRNYETRQEPHFGARTIFHWTPQKTSDFIQIVFGAEMQQGFFNTKDFGNVNGKPDTIQTNDNIRNSILSLFAQADFRLKNDWGITAGVGSTESYIRITRLSVPSAVPQKRTYRNELAPRLAISKKLFGNFWIYGSISKGFSPPTVAEVLPSTGVISTNLNAEDGVNYETGFKSSWLQQRLYIEINAFYYELKNAIVQRRDFSNADYYTNAGSTRQKGIESQASYQFFKNPKSFITFAKTWISYTLYNFRYHDFKQISSDYSGNKIPSVAPNTFAAGADIYMKSGLYTNLTYYYSDPVPLNDANTSFASPYNLLGVRIGWQQKIKRKNKFELFTGVDNIFNITYSLGNDINAAGGRYYNAAPGINYYIGASFKIF